MATFYKAKNNKQPNRHGRTRVQGQSSAQVKDINNLTIDTHDHSGQGICLSTQPITVVEDGLQSEVCDVDIVSQTKKVTIAKLKKIHENSPLRLAPFCQYYQKCGGCSLQHTSAFDGLRIKENALKTFLFRQLNIDENLWLEPLLSDISYEPNTLNPSYGYRRRVRLALDSRNKNAVKIGFRAKHSQSVIDVKACPIASEPIYQLFPIITQTLKSLQSLQNVGQVIITEGANVVEVALTTHKPLAQSDLTVLSKFSREHNCDIQVLNKLGQSTNAEFQGKGTFLEDTPGRKLQIQAKHFMQVNARVNSLMIERAIEWLQPQNHEYLYDFFCGAGNFAINLAEHYAKVFGFEGVDEMVRVAGKNAANNLINNCIFENRDLADVKELSSIKIAKNSSLILDPSREGAKVLCEVLVNTQVDKILYVSCNPNSLMRDLKILACSYKVEKISALDMFPYTKHMEAMVLLTRV